MRVAAGSTMAFCLETTGRTIPRLGLNRLLKRAPSVAGGAARKAQSELMDGCSG
jgi:hypothetical protein